MEKFKIGDIVKTPIGIGKIMETKDGEYPYLIYHFDWSMGHNGNGRSKNIYEGYHCLWCDDSMLEQIEINTTGIFISNNELKKSTIEFHIMPDRYIINKGATILFWGDGTKTIVKRSKDDEYNKRLGFLTAYFQKTSGMSKTKANKYLDDLVEQDKNDEWEGKATLKVSDDAIDVLKYALREIKPKFKVGDKVKIIRCGQLYTTYNKWFAQNNCEELKIDYDFCKYPDFSKKFKIVAIGNHEWNGDVMLAIRPLHSKKIYLIGEEGVEKV